MRKLLVMTLVACGGGGGVPIDEFGTQFVEAICENEVTCSFEPDKATCVADNAVGRRDFDFLTVVADVKAGKIAYNTDAAAACLDEIRGFGCTLFAPRTPIQDSAISCLFDLFTGSVAVGGACTIDTECAGSGGLVVCQHTDANCNPNTTCCAGTCQPRAHGSGMVGSDCAQNGDADCDPALYCSELDQKCKTPGAKVGDACEGFSGCDAPLICTFSSQSVPLAPGMCAHPGATGDMCDPNNFFGCLDLRDVCDATSMKCTRLNTVGQSCTTPGSCVAFAECTNGACVADANIGGACDPNGSGMPLCLPGLECGSDHTCHTAPAGSACN